MTNRDSSSQGARAADEGQQDPNARQVEQGAQEEGDQNTTFMYESAHDDGDSKRSER